MTNKSILIAESGSSKTDWRFIEPMKKIIEFKSKGFNPNIQTFEQIRKQLQMELLPRIHFKHINEIYFYGAGFSNRSYNSKMKKIFQQLLPAKEIEVNHDILAAARSTCGNEKGITCILGTGSNSCLYDGATIRKIIGGHGFILGDEGSGAYLGKILLQQALNNDLPAKILKLLLKFTGRSLKEIKIKFYESESPNIFLAELSKFYFANKNNAYLIDLLSRSFQDFLNKTVRSYKNYKDYPVHFVGSIAHHYKSILLDVCKKNSIKSGIILKNPISSLILYHASDY